MIVDRTVVMQVLGSLIKHPQFLTETDKYSLSLDDFPIRNDKFIFAAISNLYINGAKKIQAIDIENYLSTNEVAKATFEKNNGVEFLQDAEELADENNFPYYYKKLKKINLLNDLNKQGFNTSSFYIENLTDPRALEVNSHFEELEIEDILESIKRQLLHIEQDFIKNDTTEIKNAFFNIREIIEQAEEKSDIGFPLQGDYFNEVCAGARKGIFVLRSGGSGVSKTRQAVGDACYLAFPFRFDEKTDKWVQNGSNKRVLFIATEQNIVEIQKMILAYLTGFNETRFRYGGFTEREAEIIEQALYVLEKYQENFYIVRMPNPTIALMKNIVRENVLLYDVEYVFYDYIHISPSLLNEFKGFNLRNDEVLLLFSTALKDLAVEMNVFVMSSTQLNAKGDDNSNIKNEAALAGSRAIINKADIGVIISRPTKEEIDYFKEFAETVEFPNMVTDVYKVRSGQWNQLRIWSNVNLGNLRKRDLFVTDSRLDPIEIGTTYKYQMEWDEELMKQYEEFQIEIEKVGKND